MCTLDRVHFMYIRVVQLTIFGKMVMLGMHACGFYGQRVIYILSDSI